MKKFFILIISSILLTGCNNSNIDISNSSDFNVSSIEETSENKVINTKEIYDAIYDFKNKVEIELNFKNNTIKKLQEYGNKSDKRKDMYHPCDMTLKINDQSYIIKEVGARMKGNTSRTKSFVYDNNTFNKERFMNFKLSFNQTFDDKDDNDYYIKTWKDEKAREDRKDRKLGGQKKIDTKWNKNFDYSQTRAPYAFYIYEQEGLVAQKDNLIKLTVKNETDSVTFICELLEAIDSSFLKNHMSKAEAKGNLYKCLYSNGAPNFTSVRSIGIESPSFTPSYDLKTNDDIPDHSLLINFINTISGDKRSAKEFKPTLDNLVDIDKFLKYSALSWVIGNPDDMRNNYNNFYTYFNSSNNKLMIIPYDLDRCFGILQDWPIHTENYAYNSTIQVSSNTSLKNPLFYRTIISDNSLYSKDYECVQEYKTLYEHYCYIYAQKYLNVEKFQEFTNNFIWVNKDISKGGGTNLSFSQYANAKLKVAPSVDPIKE